MLTLIEVQKGMGKTVEGAVIRTIAKSSDFLATLPFQNIEGNALTYNVEQTLPGVAFRGINEAFPESTGIVNPVTETLVICGGDIDVDTALVDTGGPLVRAEQISQKLKSLAHNVGYAMVKGDSETDPRTMDGIQKRVFGTQIVESQNSPNSNGEVITWQKLSELRDKVTDPTHWLMTQQQRRDLEAGLRNGSGAGSNSFIWSKDDFGRPVASYGGLPILIMDRNEDLLAAIGANETTPAGGTNLSSIYCASIRLGGLQGIQHSAPKVKDLGEIDEKPVFRVRVQWMPGIALKDPRCIARLRGILKGAAKEAPAA